ncbi:MAG: glycogen debranching enzyme N-terminal domain-containing protein [Verrucomicrobiales bacterium]|nr:glycogen debranching enzyme N-terminal domain-containing protein [Verrucomicrobiales bacterium]
MAALIMTPAPGERLVRFVGDRIRFTLQLARNEAPPPNWRASLRTNLGRGARIREEVIRAHFHQVPPAGDSWHDIPMHPTPDGWEIEVTLAEVGFFRAKAYATDADGHQQWPDGPDFGLSVHPDLARTGNTIYCAWPRQFGPTRFASATANEGLRDQLKQLDALGYTVIPPSGKLRDLTREMPHIMETLGFRVLHLLPIHPTPTTFARYGRFGSPYACLDFTAIDPALVEFDRRTTGIDQFKELAYAAHERGGRVFIDVVINHTGWGAKLQEDHPEWYLRGPDGKFVSPGAWGVTWEDLAELEHRYPELWMHLAEMFLTWCRRGVDGFRCDAGYKVPLAAWQYIISTVRQEFPNTVFLLEGLGGPWDVTEQLLTEGGMQWAYSELFQNFSGREVSGYLDYSHRQSERVGTYVHYSETHDNNRLAGNSGTWSLLRNQLSALTSSRGGFGITAGVEWLAAEKILVHDCGGLNWEAGENIVPTLTRLNRLLCDHPCFFDGAVVRRLSPDDSAVYALSRVSATGQDRLLVLINTDVYHQRHFAISRDLHAELGEPQFELLGHARPSVEALGPDQIQFSLLPGACLCLSPTPQPIGLQGADYRNARGRAAWAVQQLSVLYPPETLGHFEWQQLSELVDEDPVLFLAAVSRAGREGLQAGTLLALNAAAGTASYTNVVEWNHSHANRISMVPPRHWLLLRDDHPFRAHLQSADGLPAQHLESIPTRHGHIACFYHATETERDLGLTVERYGASENQVVGKIRWLASNPHLTAVEKLNPQHIALLTNGRGGMARMAVGLGNIRSKYDCALGANLHPSVPVDRHVLVKRLRMWVVADGFISALNADSIVDFVAGPPCRWRFEVNAGDGRRVRIELESDMLEGRNATVFRLSRQPMPAEASQPLPKRCEVSITVRVDLEDRNFHSQTKRNEEADRHFASNSRPFSDRAGFSFTPDPNRRLSVYSTQGTYHPEAEWSMDIAQVVEQERGQEGHGDAFSPGWFSLPVHEGQSVHLVLSADESLPSPAVVEQFQKDRQHRQEVAFQRAGVAKSDKLSRTLVQSCQAFVTRRDDGKTVIAGYPWFLDWGRDSLIAARGLLAAGLVDEVKQLLLVFGKWEANGTLPNTIHGENASNRDTSDAPLWFGVVCEELAAKLGRQVYSLAVDGSGRTLASVLSSIATGYRQGTPNGIRMDPESGLIWSPAHFTWMDTNYPAGTPREGYPVEIQALWIRLLRQLARISDAQSGRDWQALADQAQSSLEERFWLPGPGYFSDLLIAPPGTPASAAVVDGALRSNGLFVITLGLAHGERARRTVEAALNYLAVPGALRTLAPLPVHPPLAIHGNQGQLLNDPNHPYWGHYAGDEDTRRKPAYHNGTAWTWTFPSLCEALALAWDRQPEATAAAKAYLGSVSALLREGCLGHLPEIVDGDLPHAQRGCDAQAWGSTEALRVWRWLNG